MTRPLILRRRLTATTGGMRPLPEHHYDPTVCANVTPSGELLVRAAPSDLVGAYTQTQEPSGLKQDD